MTNDETDWRPYRQDRNKYYNTIRQAKNKYYTNRLTTAKKMDMTYVTNSIHMTNDTSQYTTNDSSLTQRTNDTRQPKDELKDNNKMCQDNTQRGQ